MRGVAITAVIAVGLAVMPKLFAEIVMVPCEGRFLSLSYFYISYSRVSDTFAIFLLKDGM